jgi:hypothetical protein
LVYDILHPVAKRFAIHVFFAFPLILCLGLCKILT